MRFGIDHSMVAQTKGIAGKQASEVRNIAVAIFRSIGVICVA